jgi:hypothetical protein
VTKLPGGISSETWLTATTVSNFFTKSEILMYEPELFLPKVNPQI